MREKNSLLTFDYELFLGKNSGSVDNCLIKPTNDVLKVLNKHQAKGVFFVDTTYIFRLQSVKNSINAANDYDNIYNQLVRIVKDGHYLYHHLHPHWLDASYNNKTNKWNLSNDSRFSFADISVDERDQIFKFSTDFLKGIYKNAAIDIEPNGYRAGGLYIEPFQNFLPFFKKYNIVYEFSVVPGLKKTSLKLNYDFSKAPSIPYRFNNDICVVDEFGSFTQFPVTRIDLNGLPKILNGLFYRYYKYSGIKIYGDGIAVSHSSGTSDAVKKQAKKLNLSMSLSVESMNPVIINLCLNHLKNYDYIHFLSHPKLLTPKSIKMLDIFLAKAIKENNLEFDFKKFGVK